MPMRVLRHALAAAGLLGLFPAIAPAQSSPAALLKNFKPTQSDAAVEYDTPTDPAAVEACKVETVKSPDGKSIGYAVRDGQGRLLRRFVDTNGKKDAKGEVHLDQWSYYQNGFEVYREIDLNEDGAVDECRWLNAGGTKVATVQANRVVGWKRLSAEEASKLMVAGLLSGNVRLIETLLATPEDLAGLGAPQAEIARATREKAGRTEAINALRQGLLGWSDKKTTWQRFDGTMPHVIPADAGLKADLVLYENAFIFAQNDAQTDPMKMAYLQVPELVRIGETWKFVGLPRAVNPAEPIAPVADTGIRAALFHADEASPAAGPSNPELDKALKQLAEHDKKAPGPDGTKQALANWHYERVKILGQAIKLAEKEEDRLNYTKQAIDSLAAAYQTGLFEGGAKTLEQYAAQPAPVGSYAAYRKILADYARESDEPGANFLQVQKDFLGKLEGFLTKYPGSPEAPDVLFQLASINEFNAEEDQARAFYGRLVKDLPDTDAAKKAAGALRRLDLVGKPLALQGAGLDGKPVSSDKYAGKTLLVAFWTAGADPVRRDLPELLKVYQKHHPQGFEVIGVNLDNDRATLDAFLTENSLPWPQIFEPGGMDSRLADEFGIISLPTMILVGPDGKVVNRNIRTAAELDRYLERLLAAGSAARVGLSEK
jgi:thiol-disulfide isomerase/thioredoxin